MTDTASPLVVSVDLTTQAGTAPGRPVATGGSGSELSRMRPEIQGLRAVAVGLVVLYHLWPNRLPGGYVGVDVFFVISGFLITAHIMREVESTGTLQPGRFWARRIRRLLPASLLVLLLSGIACVVLAPRTLWETIAHQISASALYAQNWALAFDSVDYMALDNEPTVAQHYWSLSVEEQFYLVWPLLVLLAVVVGARRGAGPRRSAILVLTGVVVLSFSWSVWSTAVDQAVAYFSTFTRAWEFAAGGLTALLLVGRTAPGRRVLGWLGLGLIVAAAVAYDGSTAFPGYTALLPVVGTVLVIVAGAAAGRSGAGHWLSTRPMTFLGDISYSVYLVHWPLIVLLPYWTGVPLRTQDKLAIGVATLALAWVSKRWVEDPLRVAPVLARSSGRAVAFALVGSLVVVGTAQAGIAFERYRTAEEALRAGRAVDAIVATAVMPDGAAPAREPALTGCIGPAALRNAAQCPGGPRGAAPLSPPSTVVGQATSDLITQCQQTLLGAKVRRCDFGDRATARRVVALVGDSHAGALAPAAERWAANGWAATVMAKGSCPISTTDGTQSTDTSSQRLASCRSWRESVVNELVTDRSVTDVFITSFPDTYTWVPRPGRTAEQSAVDGFAEMFGRLAAAGKTVHVIRDVPGVRQDISVPTCLVRPEADDLGCDVPRGVALPPDPSVLAAQQAARSVGVIDVTDLFCDAKRCYSQVGGLVAYRDRSHLTVEYARLLAPFIAARAELS